MATAQIFRDTRYSKDEKKAATVKIILSHKAKSTFIATNVRRLPSQWNKESKKVKDTMFAEVFGRRPSMV